ncbi:MAG: Gfo/Idh/MocA family oxidoreductase [Planctomycetia bacterium]|nr:Gfo/Idh/MocA family oxidoreductase [Planctomycetia bacterium]
MTMRSIPAVHAGEENTIRLALIGCGGRGTGAVADAMMSRGTGPIQLVAMADVFPDRLDSSYRNLSGAFEDVPGAIDVPEERRFIGFDAYKKAIDCLNPGDIAAIAGPCGFRPQHFRYAVGKGVHVFAEKPFAVDAPTIREFREIGRLAAEKNLKVCAGLMCRHCDARRELLSRIRDGAIGDIVELGCWRMEGSVAYSTAKRADQTDLEYQLRVFRHFFWSGGGMFMDLLIHNIDECCWMKEAWPVKAQGMGGRSDPKSGFDPGFDHHFIEYTFADGTKLMCQGRNINGCWGQFASYAHGTKGAATISTYVHTPAKCAIFPTWDRSDVSTATWAYPQPESNPYHLEWRHLVDAIRQDTPMNECERGADATLTTLMGMMAVHSGQEITWDQAENSPMRFCPDIDAVDYDQPAPVTPGPDGYYARPQVGQNDGVTRWY